MSELNILDLNDDCLSYLLNHLQIEDQINFAQVCCRFRELFILSRGKQFDHYVISELNTRLDLIAFCICRERVQSLIIDLNHFGTTSTYRCNRICQAPLNCCSILCLALESMFSLRRLVIRQLDFFLTPIVKPFELIINASKGLEELHILELHAKDDWTFDNLHCLTRLEEVHLYIPNIPGPVLVKCCKSNPNLRRLHLGYNSVKRNLGDIVPHCKNLESLQFGIMAEASDYKQMARLPKLKQLTHFGVRKSGSFVPLLKALAARPQLQSLEVDGGTLSAEETIQICRLSGLQHFKCYCATAECVEMLSQLTQLQQLYLWMSSRCDISKALLKVLRECKQLQLLRIAAGNLNTYFIEDVLKLLYDIRAGRTQQPLQLEVPATNCCKELPFRTESLNCVTYEPDSWKQ